MKKCVHAARQIRMHVSNGAFHETAIRDRDDNPFAVEAERGNGGAGAIEFTFDDFGGSFIEQLRFGSGFDPKHRGRLCERVDLIWIENSMHNGSGAGRSTAD